MTKDQRVNLSKTSFIELEKIESLRNITITPFDNEIASSKLTNNIDIKLTHIYESTYPPLLKLIHDPPLVIYHIGELPTKPMVSVVGSRNPSEYGKEYAYRLSKRIAKEGYIIVSGMAKGIDGLAHIGALESGTTIAVLGNGVDVCYPRDNLNLYNNLKKSGTILSEYNLGVRPEKYHFPQRNRIIAGLSFITIIVEASPKSGSLITANLALGESREVFCLPNRIIDQYNGTNLLIKEGAGIITNIEDFVSEIKSLEIIWKNIYYCKGI